MLAASGGAGAASTNPNVTPLGLQARWVARHGGVTGTCAGCATPRMRSLSRALVVERFYPAGPHAVQQALCVVGHESGFNPGAVNYASMATGFSQIETQWHPEYSRALLHDPIYSINATWNLSRHGHDFWTSWLKYARYRC